MPSITSQFHKLDDVAWYVAAYNLAKVAFQPMYGRLYVCFRLKPIFCVALGIFVVGSAVCAAAPTSEVLVLGRFVQGTGAAGIWSGALTVAAFAVSKEKLPFYVSLTGSVFAVATVMGPTVGGALAESSLTWRACFWINIRGCPPSPARPPCPPTHADPRLTRLPCPAMGIISVILVLVTFVEPDRPSTRKPLRERLASLDPFSTCILLGSLTSLVLGLQWGGVTLPWGDSRVVGCLVGSVAMLAVFVGRQVMLARRR